MESIEKVKLGVSKFFDKNILSGYNGTGWKAVLVPSVAAVAINSYADKIASNELLISAGIVKDGMVDVDAMADEIKKRISESGLKVDISMLGSATFYRNDVDELLRMIKEGY